MRGQFSLNNWETFFQENKAWILLRSNLTCGNNNCLMTRLSFRYWLRSDVRSFFSGGYRISKTDGAEDFNPRVWVENLLLGKISVENCNKWKKLDQEAGPSQEPPPPFPLDQPMYLISGGGDQWPLNSACVSIYHRWQKDADCIPKIKIAKKSIIDQCTFTMHRPTG